MGRDRRQIGSTKNRYPDRCYLYGADYINENNEVNPKAEPICRFYKRDLVSFAWKKLELGNGSFSNSNHFIGTIETLDHVEQARVGMYVKDQTGMLFVIDEPLISDDANKSKVVGMRPSIRTTMTLRGIENYKIIEDIEIIPPTPPQVFNIVATLSHVYGDEQNPTTIEEEAEVELLFTADENYILPEQITVSGASYQWHKNEGKLRLYNATDNVSISITATLFELPVVVGNKMYLKQAFAVNQDNNELEVY